ncbi:right-handed parallel beta-helix repeat-containing protein [Actinomadura sp. GC306]|uniref:right-handed parallel beta-helix repeat-containing protein n=1 Tax=Actinomadura sp. GC306 TaxID=2530367 RepID=UPI00140499B8|nr:right-handed parallel beta-helix repeat-containing protein [Actinomadura sp. GC306]
MRRTLAVSLGTAVAFAAFMPAGQAATDASRVHVVKPGRSIQKAVNKARPGDVIQLKAGRYDGGVLVRKPLTIRGAGDRTVLRPGRKDHCAKARQAGMGICVVGREGRPVRNVTVEKLSVQRFKETGVFGIHTDRLSVVHVLAKRNGEYGIAEYNSTRGRFLQNRVHDSGAHAGLYVGDIADAHGTVVAHNRASGNAMGLLVRHARNVKVHDNTFTGNCAGVLLVDDGQRGGQGNNALWENKISKNNRGCKAYGPVPALKGTGIMLIGGDHNSIKKNDVTRNRGKLPYSGGIVLFPGAPPQDRPARHNVVEGNRVLGNAPFDLVDNSGSKTNKVRANRCKTSKPRGLC